MRSRVVLCVDDRETYLGILRRVFERAGWIVVGATTSQTARQMATTQRFDFMVLDLVLPGQTGIELLQALYAGGVTTPAVILTGYPNEGAERLANAMNVRYMTKDRADLIELVQWAGTAAAAGEGLVDSPEHDALRSTAAALRQHGVAAIAAYRAVLARRLLAPLSFADFMSIADALRALAERDRHPERLAHVLETLAARLEGRRKVAYASGVEERFQRGLAEVPAAKNNAPMLLGWQGWHTEHAAVMRRAALEVARTSEQVAQIAYRLGFDHPTVFTRHFGLFFGCSPREFRAILDVTD